MYHFFLAYFHKCLQIVFVNQAWPFGFPQELKTLNCMHRCLILCAGWKIALICSSFRNENAFFFLLQSQDNQEEKHTQNLNKHINISAHCPFRSSDISLVLIPQTCLCQCYKLRSKLIWHWHIRLTDSVGFCMNKCAGGWGCSVWKCISYVCLWMLTSRVKSRNHMRW